MRKCMRWWLVCIACVSLWSTRAKAQDVLDRDSWAVTSGDWGNGDNWVDSDGFASGTPTFDDDRWALVDGGTATVTEDAKTSGLTIGGGTVEINAGRTLEVAIEDGFFSVGQTQIAKNGTLRILGDGSYKGLDGSVSGTIEMSQPGSFELSGDADLKGIYSLTVTGDGSPVLKVGGAAKVSGVVSPTFDGVDPGFGDSFTFLEAGSIDLGKTSVELPASVSLGPGLVARVVAEGNKANLTFTNLPVLEVNRASGASKIMNVVGGPITLTGYSIDSALGTMNPETFTGFGGDIWDRPNPITTSVAEFSLTGERTVEVGESLEIGNVYNGGATHPLDEDVVFRFVSPSGEIRDGLVQYTGPANDLVLNVNPETGEVTIQNLSSFIDPVEITAYSISSPSGALKAADLTSFSDTGAAGAGWDEANPTNNLISELNLSGSKVFDNGTVISLGHIFDTAGARDIVMQYTTFDEIISATVEYQTSMGPLPGPTCEDLQATRIPGDADGDGEVAFLDFLALANNFGQDAGYEGGDFDCDGEVAFLDFLTLANNFGATAAASAASVPEPSSNCLLGLGGIFLLTMRRRRTENPMTTKKNLCWLLFLPGLAVMCSQANAQVCDLDDCPIDELRVFTGEVVNITGPGDLVSLRQPDNILYAVNVWGDELERVVNGVSFWSDKEDVNPDMEGLTGYRTDWTHNVTNWQNKPEFGDTESDDELEFIMTDIRWTDNSPAAHPDPGVGSHFAVTPGAQLYLELLISGGHDENRIWDIYVDGEPVVSEFDSTNYRDYDVGEVYAYRGEFVAKDDEFNVTFNQERRPGIDGNAILQAAILSVAGDPLLIGDFNSDGFINVDDYGILVANFNKQGATFEEGDINFDRLVNINDFVQFRHVFSEQPAGAASIPEPSGLALLAVGLSVVGLLRRRRHFT